MSDFFPTKFFDFLSWFMRYSEGVRKNREKLNVSIEEADGLCEMYNEILAADRELREAKSTYKAVVKAREEIRKRAVRKIRQSAAAIHAYRASPGNILKEIGLNPHKKSHSFDSPITPANLFAKPLHQKLNLISWDANGNKRHTMYILQVKYPGDDQFKLLNATMSTKYKHPVSQSFAKVLYRVAARRGSKESTFSNVAAVNLS